MNIQLYFDGTRRNTVSSEQLYSDWLCEMRESQLALFGKWLHLMREDAANLFDRQDVFCRLTLSKKAASDTRVAILFGGGKELEAMIYALEQGHWMFPEVEYTTMRRSLDRRIPATMATRTSSVFIECMALTEWRLTGCDRVVRWLGPHPPRGNMKFLATHAWLTDRREHLIQHTRNGSEMHLIFENAHVLRYVGILMVCRSILDIHPVLLNERDRRSLRRILRKKDKALFGDHGIYGTWCAWGSCSARTAGKQRLCDKHVSVLCSMGNQQLHMDTTRLIISFIYW